jgi:hypothetical protein
VVLIPLCLSREYMPPPRRFQEQRYDVVTSPEFRRNTRTGKE